MPHGAGDLLNRMDLKLHKVQCQLLEMELMINRDFTKGFNLCYGPELQRAFRAIEAARGYVVTSRSHLKAITEARSERATRVASG